VIDLLVADAFGAKPFTFALAAAEALAFDPSVELIGS
jgi:hypothetical protein